MSENELTEKFLEYQAYMPPLSEPMAQALEAIRAPQADTRALSRLLMRDTILAAKTFKLVNSSYFGSSSRQLASINKALLSLGAMKVKNIIIALVLQKLYRDDGPKSLFRHSIACATASEFLALEFKTLNPDDAFILGFLHDIGTVVIKSKHGEAYEKIFADSKGDYEVLLKLETENFGIAHQDIGAKLCEDWRMPKILVDSIKYHHDPVHAKIPFAAGIVYIADKIIAERPDDTVISPDVLEYLGISLGDTSAIREKILAKTNIFMKELSDF